ncbi:RNA-binding cell elongation regulator Jag/EloR [Maridesulfovibrio hydrothermalis]|uniref:RNA-binding protein KhpB n=1 Tax=Maridesulfovibrio hydrothermalis AM13 = DSM 14728 TaxID=1121451 RepID=L0REZ5_9BACT|nr:RNA-binding cell elongation regulator Jag/EloR [Maridesulfovibrio hydrothermalis]CCO25353.1 Single-stranded nucleic acid binding R3H domain protein [Maridesulfovibrio hydrothermalis AM13 = DSM 14728]
MSEFKEFQGKNLDEAINNACEYFSLNRDKLEIEILSGGSTGVFGLVGKKNAKVKARPRGVDNRSAGNESSRNNRPRPQRNDRFGERSSERPAERPVERSVEREQSVQEKEERQAPAAREAAAPAPRAEVEVPTVKSESEVAVKEEAEIAVKTESEIAVREEAQAPVVTETSADTESTDAQSAEGGGYRERRSVMEGDPEDIAAAVREALEMMIEPIVQEKPKLEIEVGEDRVNVLVDDEENSGLIIGREGQTLSSLQYLCNRMVSKKLQTSVRVQIDTGDYRERQDEKLRQLAWHLADKAMHTGRVQSTKPLSSYHRRVVHMALQEDKYVNTRSKGEGPMKRVLILPRRSRGAGGGRRNDNYNSPQSDRYNSRPNERGGERGNDRRPGDRRPSDRSNSRSGYRSGDRSNSRPGDRPADRSRAPRERSDTYRGRGRTDNYGGRGRTDTYGGRGRTDNYGGRTRTERTDRPSYGNRNRTDNYGGRGRSENYGNRPRNDNYGNRNRNENFGNRSQDENFGNRAPNDNFGNTRQSLSDDSTREDRYKDSGPDRFNSERYNR